MKRTLQEAPRQTGKWLRADVPHTGWRCSEIADRGGICEMCEVTTIAYVHVMQHDRYPIRLYCGCVCAGYMTEDPATERLRELVYKWRRAQLDARTPIEKLRRKSWRRSAVSIAGHIFGWYVGDPWDFHVFISSGDGWRYHLHYPWSTEIVRSEAFATDLLAATAGIEHAEMLMANQQWVASVCEAAAERRASEKARQLAIEASYFMREARERGREDIYTAIESGQMTGLEGWKAIRGW
jgi:hypothetical protein